MFIQIIFMLCMYPILPIMYVIMKAEMNEKNCFLFGVRMKKEWLAEAGLKELSAAYRKQLKKIAQILAALPVITFFIPYFSIAFTVWMLWLLAVIAAPIVLFARGNRAAREMKKQKKLEEAFASKREDGTGEDDDNCWIFGMLYYNPKDRRTLIGKRVGIGTTYNLAAPVGKGMTLVGCLGILLIPFCCIWLLLEEFTPIALRVEDEALVAEHLKRDYEIPLEEITKLQLLEEAPVWSKVNGTGLDHLKKGTFYVRNEGKCQVFLNPENEVFLCFKADGRTYYMSGRNDGETMEIWKQLCENE